VGRRPIPEGRGAPFRRLRRRRHADRVGKRTPPEWMTGRNARDLGPQPVRKNGQSRHSPASDGKRQSQAQARLPSTTLRIQRREEFWVIDTVKPTSKARLAYPGRGLRPRRGQASRPGHRDLAQLTRRLRPLRLMGSPIRSGLAKACSRSPASRPSVGTRSPRDRRSDRRCDRGGLSGADSTRLGPPGAKTEEGIRSSVSSSSSPWHPDGFCCSGAP
jgi:hypothetical protein